MLLYILTVWAQHKSPLLLLLKQKGQGKKATSTCPKKHTNMSDRSISLKQILIVCACWADSALIPHRMSTGTNCKPISEHLCWISGKYFLVNSSRSSSIPLNGEEKKTRKVCGSFSCTAMLVFKPDTDAALSFLGHHSKQGVYPTAVVTTWAGDTTTDILKMGTNELKVAHD